MRHPVLWWQELAAECQRGRPFECTYTWNLKKKTDDDRQQWKWDGKTTFWGAKNGESEIGLQAPWPQILTSFMLHTVLCRGREWSRSTTQELKVMNVRGSKSFLFTSKTPITDWLIDCFLPGFERFSSIKLAEDGPQAGKRLKTHGRISSFARGSDVQICLPQVRFCYSLILILKTQALLLGVWLEPTTNAMKKHQVLQDDEFFSQP